MFKIPSLKEKDDYEGLEKLLSDIAGSGEYSDIKYVLDLTPKRPINEILQEYAIVKKAPDFDIKDFVHRCFSSLSEIQDMDKPPTEDRNDISGYIDSLWGNLTVSSKTKKGSLLGLPNDYIVPGGRFAEQFYWDSYFIMLGLARQDRWNLVESMVDNCAYMIDRFGFVPSANRDYLLTRSQPPVFGMMVELLASKKGEAMYKKYLKHMIKEHKFWMKGSSKKFKRSQHNALGRVVQMPGGEILNRYYDNKKTPRPESVYRDQELSNSNDDRDPERLYLHIRAAAESGWDFSSRWFTDGYNMKSIRTADIVPVDLNCLLYKLEMVISKAYEISGKHKKASKFAHMADVRKSAILKYCWSKEDEFFSDYDFYTNVQTSRLSLAGTFPLLFGLADKDQAKLVATGLEKDFLKVGGLVTTLSDTGQQWDYPNGWAPLQWIAVSGLKNYGFDELASEIIDRWMKTIKEVFKKEGSIFEKYNVVTPNIGLGGEYITQKGFGWTNGVYVVFDDIIKNGH